MRRLALFVCGLAIAAGARAGLTGENLLQGVPVAYKIGFQERQGPILTTEMVPEKETVGEWMEMLTTQVFFGLKTVSPAQFQEESQKKWLGVCPEGKFSAVASGEEKGYPFAVWMLSCPYSKAPGRPEYTWFKALRGADSFYVVQKAFRFEPAHEQVVQWMQYLKAVALCDSRVAERACPQVK